MKNYKKEFEELQSQLSYNMKQIEFQEVMGKMEVLGELIIEEMSLVPENIENTTFEEEFKDGGVVVGKRHSEEDENGTGERFLVESTGQVVEVEFARDSCLRLACELVNTVVIFGVVECICSDHVLDFDGDVLEVPGFNSSSAQVLDHSVNTCVDVVFVLSASAHSTSGAEHEDCKFWFGDSVNDTRKLFGLILAVELNSDVWKVKFFSNTGACNYVYDS